MDATKSSKILIVDDEPHIVMMVEDALRHAGYANVVSTVDASGALDLYRAEAPDLVILDLRMPGVDGLRLLEALHAEVSPDDYLPIIVLTGDIRSEAKVQALYWGAKDFIAKPFDPLELLLRVRILLETRGLVRRLAGEKAEGEARADS